MENQFFTWDAFVSNFGKEMRFADEIYNNMVKGGLVNACLGEFDFTFESDKKENLANLKKFLRTHYSYTLENVKEAGELWELNGQTYAFQITRENMLHWALDMSKRGYEFDCKFTAYGAGFDSDSAKQSFIDLDKNNEEKYLDDTTAAYDNGDISGSFFDISKVIAVNPRNVDAYYFRAIVKSDLHTWKSALRDYDKAIELAPDYVSAWLNRGSLKDDNDDHIGAIDDYNEAIRLSVDDQDNLQKSYFNRGNSKYNLGDKEGACADWKKAFEYGADYAQERIVAYCQKR